MDAKKHGINELKTKLYGHIVCNFLYFLSVFSDIYTKKSKKRLVFKKKIYFCRVQINKKTI